jgi:hypothetical protein
MRRIFVLFALALTCFALDAGAQSAGVIGLGLAVSSYDPTGPLGQSATSIGPLIRIKMGPGFGPTIGFDWYSVGVETTVGGQRVYLGRVRVRPVMAGVAYNWNRGKYWLSMSVVGGYAFARLAVNDRALPALRSGLGAGFLSVDAGNSFVWRPQLGVWYDAAARVGVTASIAYIGVRPMLRVASDTGVRQTRLDAACTVLTFGLVFGVF